MYQKFDIKKKDPAFGPHSIFRCCMDLRKICIISLHNINPLKPELNPICYLLALLGAHHFLHVIRIRVKLLNLR